MWTPKLLTFCWMTFSGGIDCAEHDPGLRDAIYPSEQACVIAGHLAAVRAAAKTRVPLTSIRAECVSKETPA